MVLVYYNLTRSLAMSRTPPMGANMTPMMKKSGRTVFGVKMGLSPRGQCWCPVSICALHTYCHAFSRCWRNAVSVHLSVLLCSSARAIASASASAIQAYSGAACSWSSWGLRGSGPGWISSRWAPSAGFATCWANPRCSAATGVGVGVSAEVAVVW